MRIILATAIIALVPTAAMAADGPINDGYVSVSAGYNSLNSGDYAYNWTYYEGSTVVSSGSSSGTSDSKADGLDLEARTSVSVPISSKVGSQLDLVFSRTAAKWNCSDCQTYHLNQLTFAGHAYLRPSGKFLVGAIVQRTLQDWSWSSQQAPATYYMGGEAQAMFGRGSVTGQVTYGTVDANGQYDEDGINAAVQLRFFPKDDLGLVLRGGYERMKMKPGADSGWNCPSQCYSNTLRAWEMGGKAEFRLASSRFNLFADVDYRNFKFDSHYFSQGSYDSQGYFKASDFRVMAGIKLNFGGKSQFERDRSGASLDPVRAMTNDAFIGLD